VFFITGRVAGVESTGAYRDNMKTWALFPLFPSAEKGDRVILVRSEVAVEPFLTPDGTNHL
jgi:hypothetical protein